MLGQGFHPDLPRSLEPTKGRERPESEEEQRERLTCMLAHMQRHREGQKGIPERCAPSEKCEALGRGRKLDKERNRDGLLERQSHEGD